MKQNMYGSRPTSTHQKTTLNTPKSQSESQIAKETQDRRKRQQDLQKKLEDEENLRIQEALSKKKNLQNQITQNARAAIKQTPLSKKDSQPLRSPSPDPKQEAQQDFQKFLNKVKEAAGATNMEFLERNLSQSKSRINSARSEPIPLDQSRQRISELPQQKIDPLNDMKNDEKTLISSTDDQEYDDDYNSVIFMKKEQLQVEMLSDSSDEEEYKQQKQLSIKQKQNELREMTESKKMDRSVLEQVKQFKQNQERAQKIKQQIQNKPVVQKLVKPPVNPKKQDQSRLSLDIKNFNSQEKQLENELLQIDQKLYKLDQLSIISPDNANEFQSVVESSVFDNYSSKIDDATQIELQALNIAVVDQDGHIINKDEVAAFQRKLRAEHSRKIISDSTKNKAKKQLQVVNMAQIQQQQHLKSPQKQQVVQQVQQKLAQADQSALNALFSSPQVDSKEEMFREIKQEIQPKIESYPVKKIQNIYDTAPAVELAAAVQNYDGELNTNFVEQDNIYDESDVDDLYGNMQSVHLNRGSVEYKGEIYEQDDDEEDYDFGQM